MNSKNPLGRQQLHTTLQIGFQSVTMQNFLLVLNNQPIFLHAVNRQIHNVETGHVLSLSSMLHNIIILQTHNFNAVCCIHYPNHVMWYGFFKINCLYMVDEANIESHRMRFTTMFFFLYSLREEVKIGGGVA